MLTDQAVAQQNSERSWSTVGTAGLARGQRHPRVPKGIL
jgi:hypothetical protein